MQQLIIILLVIISGLMSCTAQKHPSLLLTQEGLSLIREREPAPLFVKAIESARSKVDFAIQEGIDVPIPKDMAGGYTHEKHKNNYKIMHLAGALYQITGDTQYAEYIRSMLLLYAKMYPSLSVHPTQKSYATGKIFWQCLNDANWLVYTSQAYDCVYDFIPAEERSIIEKDLFRPFADFISVENPQFFNRIHNHSTWANAAVGMIGIVMQDDDLIEKALYGLKLKEGDDLAKDNDGGFIYENGISKAGFLAQIDDAFSPDGYYTEGPYYQRYAMTPFMLFASALHNNRKDIRIFEYRDKILLKAVHALLQQTSGSGAFFPINDSQKGMSYMAGSVITAVHIAYGIEPDPTLLDIANQQKYVLLDQNGYNIAKAIEDGKMESFNKVSLQLTDGKNGDEGALGILRGHDTEEEFTLAFKYAGQGLGHGHFDKLSYSLYDGDTEVFQDYGAARWVNIDQKAGGRYLPENKSWAKQTIAHNTLILDQTSHFGGIYENAKDQHSEPYLFDISDPMLQVASAKDANAYNATEMHRTLMMWQDEAFDKPVVIDIMAVYADSLHDYELPYQYSEQLLKTSFDYELTSPPTIMGEKHGYQHVYKEAEANIQLDQYQINWFKDFKFYTVTGLASMDDEIILARAGANDPNFNIRKEAMWIHRKKSQSNALYLSVLEAHGSYSTVTEIPTQPFTKVKNINLISHDEKYTVFSIESKEDQKWIFMLSNEDTRSDSKHHLDINDQSYNWTGPKSIKKVR